MVLCSGHSLQCTHHILQHMWLALLVLLGLHMGGGGGETEAETEALWSNGGAQGIQRATERVEEYRSSAYREDMETYSYMLKKLKIYIYQERNTRNRVQAFILIQEQRNWSMGRLIVEVYSKREESTRDKKAFRKGEMQERAREEEKSWQIQRKWRFSKEGTHRE